MSHESIENIIDKINEVTDTITFLTAELENCSLWGKYDEADDLYGELVDARNELAKLEGML
jgi:FtsZ-binding cell division protein ZapB